MLYPAPKSFLNVRIEKLEVSPSFRAMCPGFEQKKWRAKRLARHLLNWLPEFALRIEEFAPELSVEKVNQMMEDAAKRMYANTEGKTRGEIGELLLHICCRQIAGTFPAVSKLFYKTATNDVVKGFDLVHTRLQLDDTLEIWLGEAKFWEKGAPAIRDAIRSIRGHLESGFLEAEKTLVGPKMSPETPGYEQLQWIFDADTSLDEIFDRMVVPVLIAYDSATTASWTEDEKYNAELLLEIERLHKLFENSKLEGIDLVCFYLPMDNKALLTEEFEARMKAYAG
jgi:hypothetical protein